MAKGSSMGKDPAVSWVFNDWQGGTMTLSRFLKGCYMDLLTAQFNNGHLSLDEIKTVLGSDFGSSWPTLQKKFKVVDGLYFNERLEMEIVKRKSYNKSRRQNLKDEEKDIKAEPHMGIGNGIGLENEFETKKGVQGEKNLIDVFFNDLENCSDYEIIAAKHGVDKRNCRVFLEPFLESFRIKADTNYKNFHAFVNHFKNHVNKEIEKRTEKGGGKLESALSINEQLKQEYLNKKK